MGKKVHKAKNVALQIVTFGVSDSNRRREMHSLKLFKKAPDKNGMIVLSRKCNTNLNCQTQESDERAHRTDMLHTKTKLSNSFKYCCDRNSMSQSRRSKQSKKQCIPEVSSFKGHHLLMRKLSEIFFSAIKTSHFIPNVMIALRRMGSFKSVAAFWKLCINNRYDFLRTKSTQSGVKHSGLFEINVVLISFR